MRRTDMRNKISFLMAMVVVAGVGLMAGRAEAGDNTGTGGVITYTDSNGLNPTNAPIFGGYVIHTFTNSGTLTLPVDVTNADVLVVAGGGAGGLGYNCGGGGGAGGYIYSNGVSFSVGPIQVTVGVGGTSHGASGSNSVLGAIMATGGGGGGDGNGKTGGSGGGCEAESLSGGTGIHGQGYNGAAGSGSWSGPAGGGGGAGGAGSLPNGGAGVSNAISGAVVWYAGGGGGGVSNGADPNNGKGGSGIGGTGGCIGWFGTARTATSGAANTGSGGGGGDNTTAGKGGSGVVSVRYRYAVVLPTLVSIVDDKSGGPISNNTLVTYAVTFNLAMNAGTVSADDFENAGSASVTIGTVNQTSATVFSVPVTATGGGTLQLQIKAGAVLNDVDGTSLNTTSALPDDTTITVDATPPTLAGSGFADDRGGGTVERNTLVTYTVTFSEAMDASTVSAAKFGNAGTAAVTIGTVTQSAPAVFSLPVTPTTTGTLQLRVNAGAVLKDVVGNALDTTSAIPDDTTLTVSDTILPTLVSIVDNKSGGPIAGNTLVTYTVTFSEPMDAGTVDATDFGNAGGAAVTIGAVSQISSSVFTVQATPTSGGILRLQVNQSAVLKDVAGNALNTGSAIIALNEITVFVTPPTLTSIVDDKSGRPVNQNMPMAYTVTFSRDMDAGTVSAADFGNAGDAAITIGTVTETTPTSGIFTVPVTPTSTGTLQLKINAGAELKDVVGNALDTTSAIPDDTIITVLPPPGNIGSGGIITYMDSSGLNPIYTLTTGCYVIHTFTNSGTLTLPVDVTNADVLVVAGGGAGSSGYMAGGGGGAGGFIYSNNFLIVGGSNHIVTVGVGGSANGASGSNSIFSVLTAIGGGGGGGGNGKNGGSGGGGGSNDGADNGLAGTGTVFQGKNGAPGGGSWTASAGGGGGATVAGANPAGGNGTNFTISGTTNWYAGGGGGGVRYVSTSSPGGLGGGGNGGCAGWFGAGRDPTDATPNTGGGGGGGNGPGSKQFGKGGSGIVIVRYPYDYGMRGTVYLIR